jgi:hypothetical protein
VDLLLLKNAGSSLRQSSSCKLDRFRTLRLSEFIWQKKKGFD